jgi:Tetratricopeptide Repeats-Sensor/Adenylate and Guanylate cyclase catalytic domain
VADVAETIHDLERTIDVTALLRLWQGHDEAAWCADARIYRAAAEHLLRAGEPLVAYDVIAEGLGHFATDRRLRQLQALALARSGAAERAIVALTALADEPNQLPGELEETFGILGRVHKDIAERLPAGKRVRELALASDAYRRAYAVSKGWYSGINAATLALLAGDRDAARTLAREVREAALLDAEAARAGGTDAYWALATVAEAAFVSGDEPGAADWYRRAVAEGKRRFGDLASTRRNAHLIAEALGHGSAILVDALRMPRVGVLISLVGDPGAQAAADSPVMRRVAQDLERRVADRDIAIGFSSAGAGPEVLFLDAVANRGGNTHVVLPYAVDEFVADRVTDASTDSWRSRFDHAMARADEVVIATDHRFAHGTTLHEYADLLLVGLARTQALALGAELVPFILSGEQPAPDGLGAVLDALQRDGVGPQWLDPSHVVHSAIAAGPARPDVRASAEASRDWGDDTRILGILFADVVHSSDLTDAQQPLMVEHFLGAIGNLTRRSRHRPFWTNTWGDGMYFVFETVGDAGCFALELRDLVTETDWVRVGLRRGLTLRIGLHAGPIFSYVDPITGYRNFTGRHTIRGARIEPVTLPGQVYASREFAALAAAMGQDAFACTPVGRVTLAKHAAVSPLFVVEWRPATG